MFYKKTVLKNFEIFLGKHLCWSFFLINEVFKNTYFEEHLRTTISVQVENVRIFNMKVSAQENKATNINTDKMKEISLGQYSLYKFRYKFYAIYVYIFGKVSSNRFHEK